jgi:glycerol 3-phosphatase-2
VSLSPLLRRYDNVLLDLDGCVWVGDELTPRTDEAVAALHHASKGIAYVTNDARMATEDFVRKLWGLGLQASVREVVTVGGAIQHYLAERAATARTAFVIGAEPIWRHVDDAGLTIVNRTDLAARADVVVIAAHEDFDYAELRTATQAVMRGAGIVAGGRDASFPMPDGPWPGSGSVVAALEAATGAKAHSVGKPEPGIFQTALDRLGEGSALVIGDRLDSDLAGAHAAGLDAAIVLTGATDREAAESAKDPRPVAVGETLASLVLAG